MEGALSRLKSPDRPILRRWYDEIEARLLDVPIWRMYGTDELVGEVIVLGEENADSELIRRYQRIVVAELRLIGREEEFLRVFRQAKLATRAARSPHSFTAHLFHEILAVVRSTGPGGQLSFRRALFRRQFIYGLGYRRARFLEKFDDEWQPDSSTDEVLDKVSEHFAMSVGECRDRIQHANLRLERHLSGMKDAEIGLRTLDLFTREDLS